MVEYIDHNVGRIYDKLDELGLLGNTILMFTSDSGSSPARASTLGGETIYGGKNTTTDYGSRVPLIVHVPGSTGGRVLDDLVDMTDFLPTMADAAGLEVPPDATIDGVSFWERLQGNPGEPREWIYTYYYPFPTASRFDGPVKHPPVTYARNKRHKLYNNGDLFDVDADPFELYPLAADDAQSHAVRNSLEAVLDSFWDGTRWTEPGIPRPDVALHTGPRPRWRPVLKDASASGGSLTLIYAGVIDTSVVPSTDAYAVTADGVARTVTSVSVGDATVSLTLAPQVMAGQAVSLSYTPGTNALIHVRQDGGAHIAAPLSDIAVRNETVRNETVLEVSIAASASPVTEGAGAVFTLTRTGSTAEALAVAVRVTESGAMLAANPPAHVDLQCRGAQRDADGSNR